MQSCVDIFAPGHEITSTYHDARETHTVSGTSQATPYVAGAIARYMSTLDYKPSPANVSDWLIQMSTKDAISFPASDRRPSPNRLLYMHCYTGEGWEFGEDDTFDPDATPAPSEPNASSTLSVLWFHIIMAAFVMVHLCVI